MWESWSRDLQMAVCVSEVKPPQRSKLPTRSSWTLSMWLLRTCPDSAWEELGMDIPSWGTKRAAVKHGPWLGKTDICAFVEPVQLFDHDEKHPGRLGDTGRRSPIRWSGLPVLAAAWGIILPWTIEIQCARPRSSWTNLLGWTKSITSCLSPTDASGN